MIHESEITVRYAETDAMGVVYHANYLIWFEVARTEFLEKLGFPYVSFEEQGIMSPVVHVECDYGEPLRYGDKAIVRTKLVQVSGVRSAFSYEIFRKGEEAGGGKASCSGRSLHCLVRKEDFRPISMKKYLPRLFEAYQEVLEAE